MVKKNNRKKPELVSQVDPGSGFLSFKNQVLLLLLLVLGFYGNTLLNEFAFDDIIVITGNKYTQSGFKGIHNLFTKETFQGYFSGASELTGGRWRPLSLITFAIEHQFAANNPFIYHLDNLLLYFISAVVLLTFLNRYVFTEKPMLALITTVLFVIHPIHTEVVANIKSRDEILSFLFLILTLQLSVRYLKQDERKLSTFLLSLTCYLLALLSKENGITFLLIIPLSFWFFTELSLKKIITYAAAFWFIGGIYLLMRFSIIGFSHPPAAVDINTMPYAYATLSEKAATIIYILGKYLAMLFFPHPLSADYSFNQIPYVSFSNPYVWLTVIAYSGLLVYAVMQFRIKSRFAYGVFFYLLTLFIVSNIAVDTGAIMGERFLYLPSLGFLICLVFVLDKIYAKIAMNEKTKKQAGYFLLSLLILFSGIKTIARNADWKNDNTLFLKDVQTCPNSVRTNNAAGSALLRLANEEKNTEIKNQQIHQAIGYYEKALAVSPGSLDPVLNLGVAYFNLGNYELAEKYWAEVRTKNSNYDLRQYELMLSTVYVAKGLAISKEQKYDSCIVYFNKAVRYNPNNADAWYNLGGAYYTVTKYDSAAVAWSKTLELNPANEQAKQGMAAIAQQKK